MDFSRHGARRGRQAADLARLPDARRVARRAAGAAQGRTRARSGARAAWSGLHPRLPSGGSLRRRCADFRGRDHAADRVAGRHDDDAALPRDHAADCRHGRGADLVALCALYRCRRSRHRGHSHGAARPADDGGSIHGRSPRHAGRTGWRRWHWRPHGPRPAGFVRARRHRRRCAGGWPDTGRFRRRHECDPARRTGGGCRVLRRAVRHGGGAHRGHCRRVLATDLRHHAGDAARNGVGVRRSRMGGLRCARRRAHCGHHRRDRREQGRRHFAGPEDRLAGWRHAGTPATRTTDRRRVRLLGRGRDGNAAGPRVRVRFA